VFSLLLAICFSNASASAKALLDAPIVRVIDVIPGVGGSTPNSLVHSNGKVYFCARNTSGIWSLWRSNGTVEGTTAIAQFPSFEQYPPCEGLYDFHGTIFFTGYDAAHGAELWKSDGTPNGTVMVKDLWAGTLSSSPNAFVELNGELYFSDAAALWKTNGTEAGTKLIKEIGIFSSLVVADGNIFFAGRPYGNDVPVELWKSDGTVNGTVLVKDINASTYNGSNPYVIGSINNTLFFTAINSDQLNRELWRSDGTEEGTQMVREIAAGLYSSDPDTFTTFKNKLYFRADDQIHGREVWQSDGTEQGTQLLSDSCPGTCGSFGSSGYGSIFGANDTLFFAAQDGTHGLELWKSSGTPASTSFLKDLSPGSSFPQAFIEFEGTVYFTAFDDSSIYQVWRTDGTPSGTVPVTALQGNPGWATVSWLTVAGDKLFFTAEDQRYGSELWVITNNNPPTARGDSYTTNEDQPLTVAANVGVQANDNDVDGEPLIALLVSGPTKGALNLSQDGSFTYTPNTNINGSDSFTYKVNDGFSDSNIATVNITIDPVNDPPTATAQSVSTNKNTAKTIILAGSDIEGSALTFMVVSNPTNGTLSGSVPNLTYTPATNYTGADSFTFKANDGSIDSAPATVSITVNATNGAPTANGQAVTTNEDVAKSITLTGSDPDGNTLSFTIVTPPSRGTLSGSAPNLTYTPASNLNGSDSFTFRVSDGQLTSAPVTVNLTINPVNDAPVAIQLSASAIEENKPAGTTVGSLSSSDVDSGDSHSYTLVAGDTTAFTIVGNQLRTALAFDYETKSLYQLTVRSTDQAGASVQQPFTIQVLDINEGSGNAVLTIVLALRPGNKSNFNFKGSLGTFKLDDITPQDQDGYGSSKSFTVRPGSATVIASPPAKWLLSSITCTSPEQAVVDLARKQVAVTLLANAQITCTFTLGLPTTLRIQNYHDLNGNGRRDGREPWLANWAFTLYDEAGTALGIQTTNRQGKADFVNVLPGIYRLCETVAPGWQNTQPATIDPLLQRPCYPLNLPAAKTVTLLFGNTTATGGQIAASTAVGMITTDRFDGDVEESDYDTLFTDEEWLTAVEQEETQTYLPLISR